MKTIGGVIMYCRNCGEPQQNNEHFCRKCKSPFYGEVPSPAVSPTFPTPSVPTTKKDPTKLIMIILIAVLVAAVLVMGCFLIFRETDTYTNNRDNRDSSDEAKTATSATSSDGSTEEVEKYYQGTEILSFTGVTGISIADTLEDDGTVIYTYEVNSFSDYTDYIDALENDGYEIYDTGITAARQNITVCRREGDQVTLAYNVGDDDKFMGNEIYLAYVTGAGSAGCLTCSNNGYDQCQGHPCDICNGRGSQPCNGCGGSGLARVPTSYSNKCVVCYGQGTQICPNCDGAGKTFTGE